MKEAMEEEDNGEMEAEGREGSVMLAASKGGGRSQAALWYRITELQQKEVLLTAKQGELASRYVLTLS